MYLLQRFYSYQNTVKLLLFTALIYFIPSTAFAQDLRTKHNVKKIISIEAMYPADSGLVVVGSRVPLMVKALQKKNKETITVGTSHTKIDWEAYAVEVEGGYFKDGLIHVAQKRSEIPNEGVKVKVGVILRPEFKDELIIPIHEVSGFTLSYDPTENPLEYALKLNAQLYNNETITNKSYCFSWDLFTISAIGGSFENGIVKLSETDHRGIKNNALVVEAALMADTTVKAKMAVPLDFVPEIIAVYSGKSGRRGKDGSTGKHGKAGESGGGQRPGGDGGPGSRGQNGSHATDGQDAEDLEVYITMSDEVSDGEPILYVHIKSISTRREHFLKVNAKRGKLRIAAIGGYGRDGGGGGVGGSGGSGGGSGSGDYPGGKKGPGGDGGDGGNASHGGDGGDVTVYLDPAAKPYLEVIQILNRGGEGGSRGTGGSGGNGDPSGNSGNHGESGYSGSDGTLEYIDKKVTLDW